MVRWLTCTHVVAGGEVQLGRQDRSNTAAREARSNEIRDGNTFVCSEHERLHLAGFRTKLQESDVPHLQAYWFPMRGPVLDREEYIEQEYFFRVYRERLMENVPSQEILKTISEEILATTRLPMAIDFMRAEILHSGKISTAMFRLPHYFAPFQAYVISRAEEDDSRFEQLTALKILESEARYRSTSASMPGLFIFQLECIARNRLGYSEGLKMMAADPLYSEEWGRWITRLAGSLGERELAEIVYGASQHLLNRRATTRSPGGAAAPKTEEPAPEKVPTALFGDQEGRIAKANIGRDPLYFFAALQRQLSYPAVPRSNQAEADENKKLPPFLEARLNKIEQRLKITEMEAKGGIDLTRFYKQPDGETPKFESMP